MWKLVIEDDESKRTSVPLLRDSYTVGRQDGNTIRLTERNISRVHCKLTRRGDGTGYTLEDVKSANGVFVNGIRIDVLQELVHGDLIQIGDYRVVLQDDTAASDGLPDPATLDSKQRTQPLGPTARAAALMERPHRLVMLVGPTPGAEFSLEFPRLTIGRSEEADISVNHNSVSRMHCEVHDLGEGRFELIDKGSANGVRVNGADLRRGIVEAGDLIELGDVRFKFVGRGQIYVPGANDSQQLTVISDRIPSVSPGEGRGGWLLPILFFLVVIGLAVVSVLILLHARGRSESGANIITHRALAPSLVAQAIEACGRDDCEQARIRLETELPAASRGSLEHREFERQWAEDQLKRAERDPTSARERLHAIEQNTYVGADLRKRANERLVALDSENSTTPGALRQAPKATSDAGFTNSAGDVDRPNQGALPGSASSAKQVLYNKVVSGKASMGEIRLLRGVCKDGGDKGCVEMCRKMLEAP